MGELLIRFAVGGVVVSLFAVLGDVLRPKSFAGLFAAAPSIALATVGLTLHQKGGVYASLEGRSMMIGAGAFLLYAGLVSLVLRRGKLSALTTSVLMMPVWLGACLGVWVVLAGKV